MKIVISKISARPVLDSRGFWTIETSIELTDKTRVSASVPHGKSTGTHEAKDVSADEAVQNIEAVISPEIISKEFFSQVDIDGVLKKFRKCGESAILSISIAYARAVSATAHVPLWKHIEFLIHDCPDRVRSGVQYPRLFMNVINGGLHAGNNLNFQEYLLIPKASTFRENILIGTQVYHELGNVLSELKGKGAVNVGDEGGYAPDFKNNAEPFEIISKVAEKLGFRDKIDLGLDAAASNILMDSEKLTSIYRNLYKDFNLSYFEDPFGEESFFEFASLHKEFGKGVLVAGDDLTVTNTERIKEAYKKGSVNAVIIKPNQNGTVSDAVEAVRFAREYKWSVIVSHRSGETDDDFIADFAYGVGADGFKLGAPARGERIAKYNRLLAIDKKV